MRTAVFNPIDEQKLPANLIREYFSDEVLRALMITCLRVDIADNNDKAEIIKMLMPKGFSEIGTGTNRITFLKDATVFKIALDRRGLVDNLTEFKRSQELPMYLARTYETNLLINVCEYVNSIDQIQFRDSESQIKEILSDISKGYLFDDMGFAYKNYMNWGYRHIYDGTKYGADILVVLDYGYLYPLVGQDTDTLFRCPKCGSKLRWNSNFTNFVCSNVTKCQVTMSPTTIRHAMKLDLESEENKLIMKINAMDMPDLDTVEHALAYNERIDANCDDDNEEEE